MFGLKEFPRLVLQLLTDTHTHTHTYRGSSSWARVIETGAQDFPGGDVQGSGVEYISEIFLRQNQ